MGTCLETALSLQTAAVPSKRRATHVAAVKPAEARPPRAEGPPGVCASLRVDAHPALGLCFQAVSAGVSGVFERCFAGALAHA